MNKTFLQLKSLLKHELISGTFYMFLGGLLGAFLIFLLSLFLARKLSYSDYGTYVSLLSIYTLLTIPAGSLTATIVHFATRYFANNELGKASDLYKKMSLIWLLVGGSLALMIAIFNGFVMRFLNISESSFIIVVALTVGVTYFGIVNNAFLQSLTKFLYISVTQLAGSIARLSVAGLLVVMGLGVGGAMLGLLSFPLVILLLGFTPLLDLLKKNSEEAKIDIKEIISYALPAAIGLLALSSFITSDVILVKHFFVPNEAGLYGGLSIVGKVIFYFTAAIPQVMFPLVVKRYTKGENYKNLYFVALLLTAIPSVGITIFYSLFSTFTIDLFLGGREFLKIASLLGLYGIFITIFNFLSLTVNFFLSIKKVSISAIVLSFAILQIILINLFHQDFSQVIFVSIFTVSILLVILLVYFYKIQKS